MADITAGRNTARRFAVWGLLNWLAGGPALGLLAAYDATTDGQLSLQYPIFGTHSWLVLMGWCVPVTFALVFWLLPVLKDLPVRYGSTHHCTLLLLIVSTVGLAGYLALAHFGRPALFALVPSWACYLTAAILYTNVVWRASARTLRPSASDLGLVSGAIWLVVVAGLRLVVALGAFGAGRHDFLASSEPALQIAMLLGFVGNTGLALATAIGPEFLGTPHSRPTVVTAFRIYNTALALWCGCAAWVLPYPYGLGRILLAILGLALAYGAARLLMELRLLELLAVRFDSRRRLLTRTALGTAGVLLLLAVACLAIVGLWASGMRSVPLEMLVLPMHLTATGFFSCIVIGLFVPLLGNRSLNGLKLVLAYGGYALLLAWLGARMALTVLVIITGQELWPQRYQAGLLAGAGAVMLALWLLLALAGAGKPSGNGHS